MYWDYYEFRKYCDNVCDDLTRPRVLLVWGGLLLGLYLTGWWREDFHLVGLALAVTLFLTAPHFRGVMITIGLAALIWVQSAKWMAPAELKGFRSEVKKEIQNVGKAVKNAGH